MRRALHHELCRLHGVLRQTQRTGNVVGGAQRDIADRRRVRDLNETRDHLAERSVAADAGDEIKLRRILLGKTRGVAARFGEKHRRAVSALAEQTHDVAEAVLIASLPCHGVYDKHEFLFHFYLPVPVIKRKKA